MKLQQLKYVLKVGEVGSITKAAQELYVSQPSLTKAILNLEKEYGIKIFKRCSKGIMITPEGKSFLHYAKNIVHNVQAMDKVFKQDQISDRPHLLVAAQELYFIPKIFQVMYDQYKDSKMEFEFYKNHRSEVITAVQKGYCNLGILIRTNREAKAFDWELESTNLEIEVLDQCCGSYVHIGPNSPFYDRDQVTFEEIEGFPHICLDIGEVTRNEWRVHNKHLHVNIDKIVYCNCINLCKELLTNTDMALYTPKWVNDYFVDTPIKTLTVSNNLEYICELILIKRENEPLTYIEHYFVEEVKRYLDMHKSYE